MLLNCKIIQLLVNAVTFRREFKNQIIRVFLFILLYYLQTSSLEAGVIGIYQDIFHSTAIIHSLDLCKLYSNPDTDKIQIFKDNKKKSGVYIWENLSNNKKYIGSSVVRGPLRQKHYHTSTTPTLHP